MDVIVLNHKNKVSLQVQHVDIGSSIDLHFPNENQSFDAFQKLREIGVRCFHAGKNAPCGASVMMYSYGNDNLQLQNKVVKMEEKKYINIDNMATRLCQILKRCT